MHRATDRDRKDGEYFIHNISSSILSTEPSHGIVRHMIFVFDLDHTLLDTGKLRRAYARDILQPLGVTRPLFQKALSIDRSRRTVRRPTTPRSIFRALSEVTGTSYTPQDEKRFLRYWRDNAHRFYYADVFRILPALPGRKFLFTKGSRAIQKTKLLHRKFRSLFGRISIMSRPKVVELRRLAKRFPGEQIIFVDDRHDEHEMALKAIPGLVSVHMVRRGHTRQPVAHRRCFMVQNLIQLKRLSETRFAQATQGRKNACGYRRKNGSGNGASALMSQPSIGMPKNKRSKSPNASNH